MAFCILVMGESGSGKTTAMRNLPPEKTLYIDADGKGLQWRGWRKQYTRESMNYFAMSDKEKIRDLLEMVNLRKIIKQTKNDKGRIVKDYESGSAAFESIEYIVIDTINAVMVDDEMLRMKGQNYNEWQDLATAVYDIITYALHMRDELTILFLAHTQTERDEFTGQVWTHVKTNGKKLNKIVLESKFSNVLYARANNGEYVFETRANNSTAKTSMGAFDEPTVGNDIVEVLKRLEDYR